MKAYIENLDQLPMTVSENPLHILWTTGDPVTSEQMVFMYAVNALRFGWWEKVHLIVWGSATKLLCEEARLQKALGKFVQAGGYVSVCRLCAEKLGLMEKLKEIEGIEILYIGERFTKILQSGDRVITL